MNQENNEDFGSTESGFDSSGESSNSGEIVNELSERESAQEIDNLPLESIGSYARLEELLTDEEKEKTTNPTAQS